MKGDHAVLTKEMETWGTGLGLVEQQYQLVLAEIGGTPAADTPAASGDTIVVSSDGFAFQGNTLEVKFTVKNVSGELVSLSKSAIQFSVKTKGDVRQFSFPKTADIAPGISQAFIVEVHDASGNGVGEADVEEVVVDVTMNGQRYSTRLERQE